MSAKRSEKYLIKALLNFMIRSTEKKGSSSGETEKGEPIFTVL